MNKILTPAEIRRLPISERLRLIEELWDSLDEEADELPLPDWHKAELDKRLDSLEAGQSIGASWDEVRQRLTSKL